MKNPSDPIGNRSGGFLAYSAVPQATVPPHVLLGSGPYSFCVTRLGADIYSGIMEEFMEMPVAKSLALMLSGVLLCPLPE
jgi:hypothetical protein